jgi:HSP20 family protein
MTHLKIDRKPFEGSLNNLVDDFFSELPVIFKLGFNPTEKLGYAPVNINETEKNYQLELIAPGFEKADFKINLDQNLMTITAEKGNKIKDEASNEVNAKLIRQEYNYRSFKRSFTIDEKIDATNIGASYVNGVLIVNLPKKEVIKESAKKIEIA